MEVLVVLGIVSVAAAGVATLIFNLAESQKRARLIDTRDRLVKEVSLAIANIKSYSESISREPTRNNDLRICIQGDTPPVDVAPQKCKAYVGDLTIGGVPAETDFVLYPFKAPQAISGTRATPLTYTMEGQACVGPLESRANTAYCPLAVETWFIPDCGGATVECEKASDLQLFYRVSTHQKSEYQLHPISNINLPTVYSSLVSSNNEDFLAQQICERMVSSDGMISFKWDEDLKRCIVITPNGNTSNSTDGVYAVDQQGDVDLVYVHP